MDPERHRQHNLSRLFSSGQFVTFCRHFYLKMRRVSSGPDWTVDARLITAQVSVSLLIRLARNAHNKKKENSLHGGRNHLKRSTMATRKGE